VAESAERGADLIPGDEIAELLRKVLRREVKIAAVGCSWCDTYAGNAEVRIGGYELVVFNDCNQVDYIDWAKAPDGREGTFEQWDIERTEPISLLGEHEQTLLEYYFERAPVVDEFPPRSTAS